MATKKARRENGMGTVYQRPNGTWVGKLQLGLDGCGKPKIKYFSGKTESEVKKKIRAFSPTNLIPDVKTVTVGVYLNHWLLNNKMDFIKRSSYDALEKTVRNQILPHLGMIQLSALTSEDIQALLKKLKKQGYSYSTVKKVHTCFNEVLRYATIKGDIIRNPMLEVKMLSESLFEKKEIRIFNPAESALIAEEATRAYKTGKMVYAYGDVFILMLNTGIRLGEAIGLEKQDWNPADRTLHIRRNIQSVKRRDDDGNPLTGRELVSNTTKTYSGTRTIALNKAATEALERLCAENPDSKNIVCTNKGGIVPPERIERTFYHLLDNIGLEREGPHSLRHTFASLLFASKVDIKTVSKLLGHANTQITYNTYIHLLEDAGHSAVAVLNDIILPAN